MKKPARSRQNSSPNGRWRNRIVGSGEEIAEVSGRYPQIDVAEIKLRAERRAGELLAEMEKHPGGRPRESPLTIKADMGISHFQSHRWQREPSVPEAES